MQKLKIDSSFVRQMLESPADLDIVRTTIAMAEALGMVPLAEGVERVEQAQALLAMGCVEAQGCLFGRPVTADEFAAQWLMPAESGLIPAHPG